MRHLLLLGVLVIALIGLAGCAPPGEAALASGSPAAGERLLAPAALPPLLTPPLPDPAGLATAG